MKEATRGAVCPVCRSALEFGPDAVSCTGCGASYRLVDGKPALLKDGNLVVQEPSLQKSSRLRRIAMRVLRWVPRVKLSTATRPNMVRLRRMLDDDALVLFVGGGVGSLGNGVHLLGKRLLDGSVNLEVWPGPVVDLIADAHDVPFPDEYFDCVILQAVLEHTRDSNRVAHEVQRVLKAGGIIYVEVPFLQPVHMKSDFRRYTVMGLEELFAGLERVDSGVNGGAASTFAIATASFVGTLLSFGKKPVYELVRSAASVVLWPIKYIDHFLVRLPVAYIAAAGVYLIARKSSRAE